ncbi:MAG: glutamate synthase subunit beta [Bacteroidetes bacterium]|nr:MAG: glutamate synthase subunit beta [Bacteroidota bacterium]
MGKPTGFLEFDRETPRSRPPQERVQDYKEFYQPFPENKFREQAARCMDCGVPFCHHGCPLGNQIPEFNDAVYAGDWVAAYAILSETNAFPEFTGRICPAPCEGSCVLGINRPPVTIELIEKAIAEKAFELGLVKPQPPRTRTGKRVAIIGSGPAGLAAAVELNRAGHLVTVFERDEAPGGLLRFGIPDFKLEKQIVERRIALLEAEGIEFRCGVTVGEEVSVETLHADYDALLLAGGATVPREMPIPGRDLPGVHLAMDYLTEQNRRVSGLLPEGPAVIDAAGKQVIVIGGGDTGSDCIGTANRQGAASITQITWGPRPPMSRTAENPWPEWPMTLSVTSSHEEGCERDWSILAKAFLADEAGQLRALEIVKVEWEDGRRSYREVPGSRRELPCELALIAVGFAKPEADHLLAPLGVQLDRRGNVVTEGYQSSVPGVYAAGDMRRGQSLVVWAIAEGRDAGREMDAWLQAQG